jgi:hypothetical protein
MTGKTVVEVVDLISDTDSANGDDDEETPHITDDELQPAKDAQESDSGSDSEDEEEDDDDYNEMWESESLYEELFAGAPADAPAEPCERNSPPAEKIPLYLMCRSPLYITWTIHIFFHAKKNCVLFCCCKKNKSYFRLLTFSTLLSFRGWDEKKCEREFFLILFNKIKQQRMCAALMKRAHTAAG